MAIDLMSTEIKYKIRRIPEAKSHIHTKPEIQIHYTQLLQTLIHHRSTKTSPASPISDLDMGFELHAIRRRLVGEPCRGRIRKAKGIGCVFWAQSLRCYLLLRWPLHFHGYVGLLFEAFSLCLCLWVSITLQWFDFGFICVQWKL